MYHNERKHFVEWCCLYVIRPLNVRQKCRSFEFSHPGLSEFYFLDLAQSFNIRDAVWSHSNSFNHYIQNVILFVQRFGFPFLQFISVIFISCRHLQFSIDQMSTMQQNDRSSVKFSGCVIVFTSLLWLASYFILFLCFMSPKQQQDETCWPRSRVNNRPCMMKFLVI